MTILFYPHLPQPHNRIHRLCTELGISFHNDPKKPHNLTFYWSYNQSIQKADGFINSHKKMINRGCLDITKSRVNQVFGSRFVNPLKTVPCVRKSENQARHDGVVIREPEKPKKGFVYQEFIDTRNEEGLYVDYRIFWSGNIDMIVAKYKKSPFKNDIVKCETIGDELISEQVLNKISKQIRSFGLNFGEVDFLMKEGEPVIIDVNNVPGRGIFKFLNTDWWESYKNWFKDFIENWRNLGGFSLGHNAFYTIVQYANYVILELGSGKGSAALYQSHMLYSIEDNKSFVDSYKGGTCFHVPIKDGWYDVDILKEVLKDLDYGFLIMDGPAKGDRIKFYENFHLFKKVPFLIDDTHRPMGQELVKRFQADGYTFEYIDEVDKQSAICLNPKT